MFSSLFPTFLSCKHHRLAIDIIFCGTWNLGHLPSKPAAAAWLWLFSQTLQNGFQAAPGVHLPFLQYLALCSLHLRNTWCAFHFALCTGLGTQHLALHKFLCSGPPLGTGSALSTKVICCTKIPLDVRLFQFCIELCPQVALETHWDRKCPFNISISSILHFRSILNFREANRYCELLTLNWSDCCRICFTIHCRSM